MLPRDVKTRKCIDYLNYGVCLKDSARIERAELTSLEANKEGTVAAWGRAVGFSGLSHTPRWETSPFFPLFPPHTVLQAVEFLSKALDSPDIKAVDEAVILLQEIGEQTLPCGVGVTEMCLLFKHGKRELAWHPVGQTGQGCPYMGMAADGDFPNCTRCTAISHAACSRSGENLPRFKKNMVEKEGKS